MSTPRSTITGALLALLFLNVPNATAKTTPAAAPAIIQTATSTHIGPDFLYPKFSLTPGAADTLSLADLTQRYPCSKKAGCTYSEAHRNVPESEKKQVYAEYGVPKSQQNIKSGEIDHFQPLCAGGSNDIHNLFYQPAVNMWNGKNYGFHAKDALETRICALVKSGKLAPAMAFQKITTDWVRFYIELGLDKATSTLTDVVE